MIKNKSTAHSIAIYTIIYSIIMLPLFIGLVEPVYDAIDYHFPVYTYIIDVIKQFKFPLWDPCSNGGIPFHAEPLNPILDPLTLVLSFLFKKPYPAFMTYWIILWWWGGIGIILLTKTIYRISTKGAIITALLYVFSGFYIGHAQHISFIRVAGWLPWLFLFAELSIRKKNAGFALLASITLGIASYGGYPILLFFSGFLLFAWLLVRYAARHTIKRILIHTALIGIGAIIMWSPTLVSFFINGPEFTPKSSPLLPSLANYSNRFTAFSFFSFISPYSNIAGRLLLNTDLSMANGYIGIFSIPLLVILFIYIKTQAVQLKKYILFALFFFLIPLGGYGLVKIALYYALPPFQYMNYNSPFRLAWMFFAVIAAGYSLFLIEKETSLFKKHEKIFIIISLLVVTVVSALLLVLHKNDLLHKANILFLVLPCLLLTSYIIIQRLFIAKNYSLKKLHLIFMILILLDISAHYVSNNFTICRKRKYTTSKHITHNSKMVLINKSPQRILEYKDKFYNKHYISKEFMVFSYTQLTSNEYRQLVYNSRFRNIMLQKNLYWLSPGVIPYTSKQLVMKTLSSQKKTEPVPVFLSSNSHSLPRKSARFGSYGSVAISRYSPEQVTLRVTVPGNKPAFLASTERFAPGWKVYIDGTEQKVIKHNLFFRGAIVPAGTHTVEWKYSPWYWLPLVAASYLFLLAGLITGIVLAKKNPAYNN